MSPVNPAAAAFESSNGNGHADVFDTSLTAALAYAACGLRVVLLHAIDTTTGACTCSKGIACGERARGKHPRLSDWPNTASADPDVIRGWFVQWPLSNVGILTGQALADGTQLVVIDVDADKDGEASLEALEGAHGRLDRAWTARTGRGGWHLYLRAPAELDLRNSADKLGSGGVDVRGWHGQVGAPPSRNLGGPYEWLTREGELPPLLTASWAAVLERPPEREREAPAGTGNGDVRRLILRELGRHPKRHNAVLAVGRALSPLHEDEAAGYAGEVVRWANDLGGERDLDLAEVERTIRDGHRFARDKGLRGADLDVEEVDRTPRLGAYPRFPTDALSGPGSALVEYGSSVGLLAPLVAGAALAAAAGAVGGSAEIQLGGGWHERPILWAVLLGHPVPGRARRWTTRCNRCATGTPSSTSGS